MRLAVVQPRVALRPGRLLLCLVAAAYLVVVVLYAVSVPRWNAPDEPAHFNYVRDLATRGQFPVLAAGDFDQAYLALLTSERFPESRPVDALRYESHQPPLYYILGVPVYFAAAPFGLAGQVIGLRLFSALLGLLLLVVAYAIVRRLFPPDAWLAPAVAALVAFTPMHISVAAAIGNDPLADLILALIFWEGLGLAANGRFGKATRLWRSPPVLRLGLWVGLALLAKTTVYVGLPVAVAALAIYAWQTKRWRASAAATLALGLIAFVLAGWWFIRNVVVYGPTDPFGLARHATVAAIGGQPATGAVDWPMATRLATTAFRSFWGQFGWMGILLDDRVYDALAVLTGAAALGLSLAILRRFRASIPLPPMQRSALVLLPLGTVLVAAAMIQYNVSSFLQPQGRYLFPALIPIAIAFLLGLRQLATHRLAPVLTAAFLGGLVLLDVATLYLAILPGLRG